MLTFSDLALCVCECVLEGCTKEAGMEKNMCQKQQRHPEVGINIFTSHDQQSSIYLKIYVHYVLCVEQERGATLKNKVLSQVQVY